MRNPNVIDLTKRRRNRGQEQGLKSPLNDGGAKNSAPIVNMTERREAIIVEERRTARRTILNEFIGAFVVIPEKGLQKVALYDISDDGLSFDVNAEFGEFEKNAELALRVYLTQTTYFPIVVKTTNTSLVDNNNIIRHGAMFVKELIHTEALHHFVKFIETVSTSLSKDNGDRRVPSTKRVT